MTLTVSVSQPFAMTTTSHVNNAADVILSFFERNHAQIIKNINYFIKKSSPADREYLIFENIQNEVFLRASKVQIFELTENKLHKIIFAVLMNRGKSASITERRPMVCTSQIIREGEHDDILECPDNPLIKDNLRPPTSRIKKQRRQFAVLKPILTPCQLNLFNQVRRGKPLEIIAEERGSIRVNDRVNFRRIKYRLQDRIESLKTFGEDENLSADGVVLSPAFKALQPAARTVLEQYLRGKTPSEIAEDLNIKSSVASGYIYEARTLLYIPKENTIRIHRENRQLKLNSSEDETIRRTLEFFFWKYDSKQEDEKLLYSTINKLMDCLSKIQRSDLKAHLAGKLQKDIASERNVGRGQVRESLIRSKELILRKLDQLKNVPNGIDPFEFIKIDDYLQEKLILYFQGLSQDEIAAKTCNTKKDVIQHLCIGRKLLGLSVEEAQRLIMKDELL